MKRLLRLPALLRLTLVFFIATVFQSCSEQKIKESTDDTLNITEYLRANPNYSMFLEILDITNYASFMNTYGTYTLFLPTNEAVKEYLNDVGANSLSEVPLEDLQNIAKLHILDAKINTTSFTDGKIATPSMYGQFLITGASNENGVSSITVNKTAKIDASNIELGNGIVHIIDKVLRVADKTLAQTIEANPDLSLFTEVLKATGWFEKLNQPISRENATNIENYLTVLVQTNEVYNNTTWYDAEADETITLNTLENLKRRYSKPLEGQTVADPTDPADSLNLYVSYRVLPRLQYLADIAITPALETKAPLEVITAKLDGDDLVFNEEVFNGVLEEGSTVIRTLSDVTCSNGVLHFVDTNFAIKKRNPAPVYFDFTDQPEFKILPIFRTSLTGSVNFNKENMSDVSWDGTSYITYKKETPRGGTTGYGWHADSFEIYRLRSGYVQDLTFKTPVIIKGKYKVWISFRATPNKAGLVKVFFDGTELSRQINVMEYGNTTLEERVLESQGYKRHISPYTNRMNCKLVGTVDVPTTGRHTIMLQSTFNAGNFVWLDVCEFRPVDMDQLYPKFQSGGDGLVP